jgi:hypothetical protein
MFLFRALGLAQFVTDFKKSQKYVANKVVCLDIGSDMKDDIVLALR